MPSSATLPPVPEGWKERYHLAETPNRLAWIDQDLCRESLRDQLDRPDQFFEDGAVQWFKKGRNLLAEVRWPSENSDSKSPATLVLKKYGSRGFIGAVRARLRPGRSLRAWQGAFGLLERGFATPRPLWLSLPRQGAPECAPFLGVQCAPPHVRLREVLKQIRAGRSEVLLGGDGKAGKDAAYRLTPEMFLRELARFVRRLHDAGVWHRDFSGGNLLIPHTWRAENPPEEKPLGAETSDLILIDVNRCRFFAPGEMEFRRRLHDLVRISLDEPWRESFFVEYAQDDKILMEGRAAYLKGAAEYRRLRETRNPILRLWRKVFTYWLKYR